eukprot:379985-Prorocentrum_minimum.AAC.1
MDTRKTKEVKLLIGEKGFYSDLESEAKYEAKTTHYAPLIAELLNAGWNAYAPHDTRAHDKRSESDSAPTQPRGPRGVAGVQEGPRGTAEEPTKLRRLHATARRAATKKAAPKGGEG